MKGMKKTQPSSRTAICSRSPRAPRRGSRSRLRRQTILRRRQPALGSQPSRTPSASCLDCQDTIFLQELLGATTHGKGSAPPSPSLLAGYPRGLHPLFPGTFPGSSRTAPIRRPAAVMEPEDGNIGPQGQHVESKTFYYHRLSFIMHAYE